MDNDGLGWSKLAFGGFEFLVKKKQVKCAEGNQCPMIESVFYFQILGSPSI